MIFMLLVILHFCFRVCSWRLMDSYSRNFPPSHGINTDKTDLLLQLLHVPGLTASQVPMPSPAAESVPEVCIPSVFDVHRIQNIKIRIRSEPL